MRHPAEDGLKNGLRGGRRTRFRVWLRDQCRSLCCCCCKAPRETQRSQSGYLEEVSSVHCDSLSEEEWPQGTESWEQLRSRRRLLSLDTSSEGSVDDQGEPPAQTAENVLPQGCVQLVVGSSPLYSDILLHEPPRDLCVLDTQPAGPWDGEEVPTAPCCQEAQEPVSSAGVEPSAALEPGPSARTARTPEAQLAEALLAQSQRFRAALPDPAVEKALRPSLTPQLALPSLRESCMAFLVYCLLMCPILFRYIALLLLN
ncbi:uncharacterized protein LOC132533534 [Erinaceus europaeus]|uniref:Uncharacterized protein LOC132533532 n=1 Tax=Erinaceus europaeus TaxID=9365 RepID=A0ABM3W540_ERIEU|nr:uncharacterized protein LOC132533532 [Erinaceus europaeus]XP_060031704.1 uncharacterized protein LOC132533533 [Erinaceus europaeus]XP_060031705.1 uncharacterized protein LOC132533534 [Erinaceus europaeus]